MPGGNIQSRNQSIEMKIIRKFVPCSRNTTTVCELCCTVKSGTAWNSYNRYSFIELLLLVTAGNTNQTLVFELRISVTMFAARSLCYLRVWRQRRDEKVLSKLKYSQACIHDERKCLTRYLHTWRQSALLSKRVKVSFFLGDATLCHFVSQISVLVINMEIWYVLFVVLRQILKIRAAVVNAHLTLGKAFHLWKLRLAEAESMKQKTYCALLHWSLVVERKVGDSVNFSYQNSTHSSILATKFQSRSMKLCCVLTRVFCQFSVAVSCEARCRICSLFAVTMPVLID